MRDVYKILTVVKFQLLSNNSLLLHWTRRLLLLPWFIGVQCQREILGDNGDSGHCDVWWRIARNLLHLSPAPISVMWDVTLCHTKLRLMVTRDIVITGHQLTCARGLTSSQWFRTIDNFPGMWSSSAWPGPQLRYYPLNIKCLITQEARVWSDGCVGLEGRGVTGYHLAMCGWGRASLWLCPMYLSNSRCDYQVQVTSYFPQISYLKDFFPIYIV